MVKHTLTPPPSSPQDYQDQSRNTGMQCDPPLQPLLSSSIYLEQTFHSIAQLAFKNEFHDLVQAAERADLATSEDPNDPSRLLIIAPLVLAYLIIDDIPPARHALLRLPEPLLSLPFSVALCNLETACWQRAYEQVYSNAMALNDLLSRADFFDKDLASVLTHLVAAFIDIFRRRTFLLLLEAYTTVPLSLAGSYLGMNEEQILAIADREEWKYDTTLNVSLGSKASTSAGIASKRVEASSLMTFHHVADSVSRLEL